MINNIFINLDILKVSKEEVNNVSLLFQHFSSEYLRNLQTTQILEDDDFQEEEPMLDFQVVSVKWGNTYKSCPKMGEFTVSYLCV